MTMRVLMSCDADADCERSAVVVIGGWPPGWSQLRVSDPEGLLYFCPTHTDAIAPRLPNEEPAEEGAEDA